MTIGVPDGDGATWLPIGKFSINSNWTLMFSWGNEYKYKHGYCNGMGLNWTASWWCQVYVVYDPRVHINYPSSCFGRLYISFVCYKFIRSELCYLFNLKSNETKMKKGNRKLRGPNTNDEMKQMITMITLK